MSGLTYTCAQTGEVFDLDNPTTAMTQGAYDARSFEWGWDMSDAGALTGGGRVSKSVKIEAACRSREFADALIDALECDALAGTPGTFEAEGGWKCRGLGNTVDVDAVYEDRVELSLTVLMVDGCWRKSTTVHLLPYSAGEVETEAGLDFPFDFGASAVKPPRLELVRGPQDAACDEGGSAALSVRAIGYRLSYEWQELEDGAWSTSSLDGWDSSLVIIPGDKEHDGLQLRCVVTDGTGQQITSEAATFRLSVYDLPFAFPFDLAANPMEPVEASTAGRILSYEGARGACEDSGGFDFAADFIASRLEVATKAGALARITFFGPCANPYVVIAGNVYGVTGVSATFGERIVIDPLGIRTPGAAVYHVGKYGETTNLYSKRRRGVEGSGSYVFERLPYGESYASWPQSFGVDIEVIEERGTPPWS